MIPEQYSVICFLSFRTSNGAILYAYSGNVGGIVVISRTLVCTVKRAKMDDQQVDMLYVH